MTTKDLRTQAAYADCAAHWVALREVAAVHERLQFELIGCMAQWNSAEHRPLG